MSATRRGNLARRLKGSPRSFAPHHLPYSTLRRSVTDLWQRQSRRTRANDCAGIFTQENQTEFNRVCLGKLKRSRAEKSMKVIFLDIDGVLNSTHTANPRSFPYIVDPELVTRLKDVLAKTGAEVVLSSTWRYDPVGVLAAKHYGVPL